MREYWLDPPEDDRPVVYKCEECGEPIRHMDECYDMTGYYLCEECFDRWKDSIRITAEIE